MSGAGPAGSIAAHHCSKGGLRTLLIEKEVLPRRKCCAGGVLHRALEKLDYSVPERLVEREIRGFSIVHGDYRRDFPLGRNAGITVRRQGFDAHLTRMAESSGAEIMDGAKVMRVRESVDSVEVTVDTTSLHSRALIVAEGAGSRSARQAFGPLPRKSLALGLASEISFAGDPGNSLEIHLIETPTKRITWGAEFPLNGWLFPTRRGANVGVVGKGGDAPTLRRMVRNIAERAGEMNGGLVGEVEFCASPLPLVPRRKVCTRRILVAGDAAGFVNQITGEGMTYALESGKLAAEAVLEGLEAGNPVHFRDYGARCHDRIFPDLNATRLIGPVLHRLVGVVDTDTFFDRFADERRMTDLCLDIARGETRWVTLLMAVLPRFPRLFLSSLA